MAENYYTNDEARFRGLVTLAHAGHPPPDNRINFIIPGKTKELKKIFSDQGVDKHQPNCYSNLNTPATPLSLRAYAHFGRVSFLERSNLNSSPAKPGGRIHGR